MMSVKDYQILQIIRQEETKQGRRIVMQNIEYMTSFIVKQTKRKGKVEFRKHKVYVKGR